MSFGCGRLALDEIDGTFSACVLAADLDLRHQGGYLRRLCAILKPAPPLTLSVVPVLNEPVSARERGGLVSTDGIDVEGRSGEGGVDVLEVRERTFLVLASAGCAGIVSSSAFYSSRQILGSFLRRLTWTMLL